MKLYNALCLVFLVSISLGCKSDRQEYKKPTEVLTVVDASVSPNDEYSLTNKYCGTQGKVGGLVYNKTSKKCVCQHGELDPKLGKCVEKKSEVVYPDKKPLADDTLTAEQIIREAPSYIERWHGYDSADAKAMLQMAVFEMKIPPKKLDLTPQDVKELKASYEYQE